MTKVVEIDPREITVTPIFRMDRLENIPKSEQAGHAVYEMRELVQVRFAGSNNFSPVFEAHGFWKREGNRTITYAERWSEQYRAFKEGAAAEAVGTPLEMLNGYGITPELLSLCRALRIYSIEALHHLEGPNLKSLGMNANTLKAMVRSYMADHASGSRALDEIETLKRKIAELESRSTIPPVKDSTPEEIAEIVAQADARYEHLGEEELRQMIADKGVPLPRGRPSHANLVRTVSELYA